MICDKATSRLRIYYGLSNFIIETKKNVHCSFRNYYQGRKRQTKIHTYKQIMEQGNDHHPEDADPDCERDGNISSNDCETTNPGVPIRELLIKAKKAASSLWTVLHAQSCTNRNISLASSAIECDYPGCETTKRLLGHIKSCPAAFDILPCPTNVQGCQTVRKLLHHYKTCRHSTYTNSISTHAFTRANRPSPTSTSTNNVVIGLVIY